MSVGLQTVVVNRQTGAVSHCHYVKTRHTSGDVPT